MQPTTALIAMLDSDADRRLRNELNLPRPPLYKVTKGQHRDKIVTYVTAASATTTTVREVKTGNEFTIKDDSSERYFRTREERELGREFTIDEERAYERALKRHLAEHYEARNRKSIAAHIENMAANLERKAEELRRLASRIEEREESQYMTVADLARQAQHEVAWLFPNLNAERLTSFAIDWTIASSELHDLDEEQN